MSPATIKCKVFM